MGRFAKRAWDGRYDVPMPERLPSVTVAEFPHLRHVGKRMSARRFRRLPEEKPYLELVDGVVQRKPDSWWLIRTVGWLNYKLGGYADPIGGHFGPDQTAELDEMNSYLPATAFWAPGADAGDYSIPTVAIEVCSPNQSMPKLREKCRRYLRAGSSAAWLIDPKARTIEVFEAAGTRTLRAGGTLTCDTMPGFELALDEFFSFLDR